jgi:hypothetical protein
MQKTTFHWFGGATTEVSQDQSVRANETYHWANGVTSQVQNDFGNPATPPASISPISAAITLAVGDIKTFDELYTITGTTSADYDVVSGTPATATWGDTTGLTSVKAGTTKVTATGKAGSAADGLSADVDVTVASALNTFKIANGTATVTSGNAVALVAADGMKTIIATDSADAAVAGATATLKTSGDSTKMTVAMNADGKTVEMTPVAGQTGPVVIQIKATGYTTKEITVTLS